MTNKRILCAILSVVLLLSCVGCGAKTEEVIAPAENTYSPAYSSFCTYEHDPDIQLNAVLDESVWQGKNWFSNTFLANTAGNMPVVKVTGFTTEYGVYIASVVEDSNLVNDGQRSPAKNSNWELYLTADNVGQERPNDTVYRRQFNVDMTGDAYTVYSNFDRAVKVEGELNSGATTSATLEMFLPWEVLQIDTAAGIPEEFRVMIGYRAVLPGQSGTTLLQPVNFPIAATQDYYTFDENGYVNYDREGAVLGDSLYGHTKTANWDLSREAEGVISSSVGTEHHKIFFTGEHGRDYMVEATIVPVGALNNQWPKAGIFFQGTDGLYYSVFLDMNEKVLTDSIKGTRNFAKFQLVTLNNDAGKWNQISLSKFNTTNPNAKTNEGAKLTVLKSGGKFWYFIDGEFITCEEKRFMDIDVIPGFYALGANAVYKDYSCEKLTEENLTEYLNDNGLYMVDAKIASAGGSVSASKFTVEQGGSYQITVTSNSGYEVSSVLINDVEMLDAVKMNAEGGVYTVKGVKANQQIRVYFSKTDGNVFTGKITSGDTPISADITLTGITNPALRYQFASGGQKGFTATVPAGTYKVAISAHGFVTVEDTVTIEQQLDKSYSMEASVFANSVTVGGKQVKSLQDKWDVSTEYLGYVSTSYAAGGKIAPLYFAQTGTDFVLEATIDYTTEFKTGVTYQNDLMGGFVFSDGSNSAWILSRGSGIVYTGWNYIYKLIANPVLMYPKALTSNFAVAKQGENVYIYYNGRMCREMKWSEVAPAISPDSELALGLYMVADATADIRFSNFRVITDAEEVASYIFQR